MTSFFSRLRSTKAFGFLRQGAAAGLAVFLASCASVHGPGGYLSDYSRLKPGPHFKQEYVAADTPFNPYRKVKINPIELGHLQERGKYLEADLKRLAARFESELRAGFGTQYHVLGPKEAADSETLIVAPALISIGTPQRALNVVTSALVFVSVSSGSAAFEAKLLDGATGKVIAEMAEKRTGGKDTKSLTAGPFMKFAHAEAAFKEWAEQLVHFVESR